jgi:hypothetical protein
MTWKKVNNADAGTVTKYGGNDLDKYADALSGVDVDDVAIAMDWTFLRQYVMTRIATPSNPPADTASVYPKQIDANNDGVFAKIKKGGSFVEVQII